VRDTENSITTVILAGGLGTRIQHLLPDVPKPMAMVAGRPFLEHIVRYVGGFGFRRIILSTGHRSNVIERHFADSKFDDLDLRCAPERAPLGTAGGFLHAARNESSMPAAYLILNGDSLVLADLRQFADSFEQGHWDAAMIGLSVADAARFGTLEKRDDGSLARFAEKRPGSGSINAGVYLLRPRLLKQFPTDVRLSFETDVFPTLISRGCRILVHPVEAPFIDIGIPETLAGAEVFIRENQSRFVRQP